jgi:hypothetical protein
MQLWMTEKVIQKADACQQIELTLGCSIVCCRHDMTDVYTRIIIGSFRPMTGRLMRLEHSLRFEEDTSEWWALILHYDY